MTVNLSIGGVDELSETRKEELKSLFAECASRCLKDYNCEFVEARLEKSWFQIEFNVSPEDLPDIFGMAREG